MIIENEITFINIYEKETIYSWFIKLTITITTIILVGFVFYYHHLDLNLYSVNNSLDNWRVGLTQTKIFLILFETIICVIHPIPRSFPRHWNLKFENPVISNSIPLSYIAIDVALGLPSKFKIFFFFSSKL
jgi:potassium intermediate/small conductance calcium-activated channel subfamily N protein 3